MKHKMDIGHNDQDSVICDLCQHILIRRNTCGAFPQGIPEEILNKKNNHSKPLPGQGNDIVFGLKNNLMMPIL
jgi:hypothetical protein